MLIHGADSSLSDGIPVTRAVLEWHPWTEGPKLFSDVVASW